VETIAVDGSSVTISISVEELRQLRQALNEVCNGVRDLSDDNEFATRMGASRAVVRGLLAQVVAVPVEFPV